jgi:hypothetical protein
LTETPAPLDYRLPTEFRRLFEGKVYKHRNSSQGDFVAMHLFEDLITINRSKKLIEAAVSRKDRVLNVQNRRRGVTARRGDGTFGEIIPGEAAIADPGYLVARGPIATVEIGVEAKVLAKAMIKQIDRVINDLRNQVVQFRRGGGNTICVAVVGINQAESTVGFEGDRPFPTTGKQGFLHPFQEAPEAERRLRLEAAPEFDEFLVLRFRAPNAPPYLFEWVDYKEIRLDYAAALSRISARYQQRF